MPIYEFYCPKCNLILEFFSRRVSSRIPECPHCGGELSREVSNVCVSTSGEEFSDELGDAPFDESRMEKAVQEFGGKFETMGDDSDPKRSVELMKQFTEASGLSFNKDIRDALDRIADGEDPDKVSSELDQIMDSEADPFAPADRGKRRSAMRGRPARDPELHDM